MEIAVSMKEIYLHDWQVCEDCGYLDPNIKKDKGCSARGEDTTQLNLPNPNKERQTRTNKVTNIAGAKTGNTASKQDGAFKKEYDAETPSPSSPEEPDLGFPLRLKRGVAEGLDNASKEETTSAYAAVASIGKPSRDFSLARG
ncbi:uncharacterized protein [Aegilops tauschii subsp. strangulata]|uniref:uncharacterized protein n=1 Tax=Aegilops tauschii subsp. strangulata TaxID=200361 RepID=UPI00098B56A3